MNVSSVGIDLMELDMTDVETQVMDTEIPGMDSTPEASPETRKRKLASQQDIGKYLLHLRLPEHIKIRAADIRRKMTLPTKRCSNLDKLIFYCVYNSYIELKETFLPEELANICGVNCKDISKILRMFPSVATKYVSPIDDKSAVDYISEIFGILKTGLHPSQLPSIISLSKRIIDKAGERLDQFPENVAVAIILYYMDLNGICYNINDINIMGRRVAISTISTLKKRIETIDNS